MADIKFTSNVNDILRQLEKGKHNALTAIGATAETYAKKETPVCTGRLRNSISHETDKEAVYIGTNVEYAAFV